MTVAEKQTLRRAAGSRHKNLNDFLIDSGLDAAAQTSSSQDGFELPERRWAAFLAALDNPPTQNPRLHELLLRKPKWEQ
jgi:uncharacterized protein (DUF1778 family)